VFDPASERDGITLRVPEPLVSALRAEELDWLVPGWLASKMLALLRGLPKELRRPLVPLPDTVEALRPEIEGERGKKTLTAALRDALAGRGIDVGEALDAVPLPPELRFRIEVVGRDGKVIGVDRDLAALRRRFGRGLPSSAEHEVWSRRNVSRWDFPDLPESVRIAQYGTQLELYPALLDVAGRVDLELIPPGPAAPARHRQGVRRLLLKQLPQQCDLVRKRVLSDRELVLSYHGIGSGDELVDDLLAAAADEAFVLEPPIRTRAAFEACLDRGRADFVPAAERLIGLARAVLSEHRRIAREIERGRRNLPESAVEDLSAQLESLVRPGFLRDTPTRWRVHLPRYLSAARQRLEKLARRAPKDAEYQAAVGEAARRLDEWRERYPPDWPWPDEIVDYRWLLEEFRVSLFAQSLGTSRPVSAKRLEEAWRRAAA